MTSPDHLPADPSDWNPAEALRNLTLERALQSTGTPQELATRLFAENLPISVMSICHIATYGESEAMRFNAARYVVERTMGPAERQSSPNGKHVWDDIYEKVVSEAEGYLNS